MASRIAAEEGWSEADTIALIQEQTEFNDLVSAVAKGCPNQFSAAENVGEPGGVAAIYFKGGSIPACAQEHLLETTVNVTIVTGALENALEIDQHADDVGDYLEYNGYTDFVVGSRVDGTIDVTIGSAEPMPTFPPSIASGVVVELETDAVSLQDVSRGSTQIGLCTTAFSVYNPAGATYGISSARHCGLPTPAQHVDHLGNVVPTAFEDQGPTRWGDMEWHSTPFDNDENEIWIDYAGDIRIAILDVMTRIPRRTWICINARTNANTCDRVRDPRIRTSSYRRLVLMERRRRAGGDSGGPWYREDDASGIHSGAARKRGRWGDTFSRAEYLDDSMGVIVRTW